VQEALHPVGILAALIGVFLIPLIPMIYGALFSLVLTAVLKQVKSARVFQNMSTVFLMIFGGLFLYSLRGIGKINVENYVESLVRGDNFLFRALNIIFFPVPWLAEAISAGSIRYLLIYLAGNALLVAALYVTGKALYLEGLYTVAALGSAKKAGIKEADLKQRSPFRASFQKELRVILRTQAFANNTAYVNLLWPFGTFLLFHYTKGKEGAISTFIALYQSGKERADLTLVMVILTIAFIATALNSLASTAFTREGKHLALIKYIPVSYETQLYAKAAVCFVFTYPPLLLTDIILCFYVGVPFVMGAIYAVFMLLAHLIAMVVGIWLDSTTPYVEWDDEYSALRGNINVFFNLAVMMLVSAAVIGSCFLLYEFVKLPIMVFYGVVFFVPALTTVMLLAKGEKKILANMENLE
jgi:ABC-2 type transport system permease protein